MLLDFGRSHGTCSRTDKRGVIIEAKLLKGALAINHLVIQVWNDDHYHIEKRYPVPVCFNKCWITGQKKTHQTRIHDVKARLNFLQVALEEERLRACKRCVFQSILVWKVRAWIIPKQDSIQHYSITSLDCINFGYATQLANQRVGSCPLIASTGQ